MGCPTCKSNLEHIICVAQDNDSLQTVWTDYSIWGDSCGPDFTLDPRSQMFFPKQYYRTKVESLWTCKCHLCGAVKRDMKALRTHYQAEHSLHLCELCIEHKQSFPSEQKVYTQHEYETHLRKGDNDGSEGHPKCEFCRKRYYDKTALFLHLSKDHYSCHLCEKMGIQFKYYAEYGNLETHYRKDHYLCEDPSCLEKKFIAFGNQFDLTTHTMQWHPLANISRKIPIRFKVRGSSGRTNAQGVAELGDERGGYNSEEEEGPPRNSENFRGEASARYDGGTGGVARGGEWQIELPPGMSDPRERRVNSSSVSSAIASRSGTSTASSSSARVVPTEEYPSLAASSSTGIQLDWGSGPRAQSRPNPSRDFPALPGSGSGNPGGPDMWAPKEVVQAAATAPTLGIGMAVGWKVKTDKRFSNKGKKSDSGSFREAIDGPASLAVRMHMGEVESYTAASAPSNAATSSSTFASTAAVEGGKLGSSSKTSESSKPNASSTQAPAPTMTSTTAAPPPPVTLAKQKNDAKKLHASPAVAGWGSALQTAGLATTKKIKGLSVVKKSSTPSAAPSAPSQPSLAGYISIGRLARDMENALEVPASTSNANKPPPPPGLNITSMPLQTSTSTSSFSIPSAPAASLSRQSSMNSLASVDSFGSDSRPSRPAASVAPAARPTPNDTPSDHGPPPGLGSMGWTKIGGASGNKQKAQESSAFPGTFEYPSLPSKPVLLSPKPRDLLEPTPKTTTQKKPNVPKKVLKEMRELALGIKR